MPEAKIRVDAVMSDIERDVRTRLRRHLIKRGGAAEYHDEDTRHREATKKWLSTSSDGLRVLSRRRVL